VLLVGHATLILAVAGVKRLSASRCVAVCLYVCPQCNSKSSSLGMTMGYPIQMIWFLGQKVKGQGHRVIKCKNILKAIEWPAWVIM